MNLKMKMQLSGVIMLALTACAKSPANNGGNQGGTPDGYKDYTMGNIVATDALGRALPNNNETGAPRSSRYVGMFYWTWHYHHSSANQGKYPKEIVNISEVVAANPEAGTPAGINDPAWPAIADHNYLWWGEPLFDYYITTDKWVLRRHAEMLSMAGVDVILFDLTNGSFTFPEGWRAVFETFAQALKDGVNVPKIAFFMGFPGNIATYQAVKELYTDIYSAGLYRDLWFIWKGKPLICVLPSTDLSQDILNFFTFRPGRAEYDQGPDPSHSGQNYNQWGWLQIYPQNSFGVGNSVRPEQIPVGVAQNWAAGVGLTAMNHPNAFGRSYTHMSGHSTDPDAVNWGLNYQEQWDKALAVNPEFVFVTGWNEWLAGRQASWGGLTNSFPDLFDQEHSRDIEPMRGGHGDNYYMQTVSNIRKYKGIPAPSPAPKVTDFAIDGDKDKWDPLPEFKASKGNTFSRDSKAYDHRLTYTNTTGRNDIVAAKVAYDDKYLYFFVETKGELSPETDGDWMYLLIDSDRSRSKGWEGYDYMVNRQKPTGGKAVLEYNAGTDWNWEKEGDMDYARGSNWLEVGIPRSAVGQEKKVSLEFKWVDNMQEKGDIMDFYVNGDSAPIGRFNYLFTE